MTSQTSIEDVTPNPIVVNTVVEEGARRDRGRLPYPASVSVVAGASIQLEISAQPKMLSAIGARKGATLQSCPRSQPPLVKCVDEEECFDEEEQQKAFLGALAAGDTSTWRSQVQLNGKLN